MAAQQSRWSQDCCLLCTPSYFLVAFTFKCVNKHLPWSLWSSSIWVLVVNRHRKLCAAWLQKMLLVQEHQAEQLNIWILVISMITAPMSQNSRIGYCNQLKCSMKICFWAKSIWRNWFKKLNNLHGNMRQARKTFWNQQPRIALQSLSTQTCFYVVRTRGTFIMIFCLVLCTIQNFGWMKKIFHGNLIEWHIKLKGMKSTSWIWNKILKNFKLGHSKCHFFSVILVTLTILWGGSVGQLRPLRTGELHAMQRYQLRTYSMREFFLWSLNKWVLEIWFIP